MTSAVAPKPQPMRKANLSPLRRLSRTVLIIGTVVALIAAFGPTWAVRAGIVVALVAAIVACVSAWTELSQARRAHAQEMLAASQSHGSALRVEREQHSAVLDTMTERAVSANAEIGRQQVAIAEMYSEISTLHGDKAFLQGEIKQRETVIASLRETVRSREAELIALREEGDAEIHVMPRRVLSEHESVSDHASAADERWTEGSHPTVVDLLLIDVATIPDYDIALPNYEGERKFA